MQEKQSIIGEKNRNGKILLKETKDDNFYEENFAILKILKFHIFT